SRNRVKDGDGSAQTPEKCKEHLLRVLHDNSQGTVTTAIRYLVTREDKEPILGLTYKQILTKVKHSMQKTILTVVYVQKA
uniref:Uncharacterized protein n=1 Tax=Falco tinnunculus TaxID=100819 RepID=A0A8C4UF84_FALTI